MRVIITALNTLKEHEHGKPVEKKHSMVGLKKSGAEMGDLTSEDPEDPEKKDKRNPCIVFLTCVFGGAVGILTVFLITELLFPWLFFNADLHK